VRPITAFVVLAASLLTATSAGATATVTVLHSFGGASVGNATGVRDGFFAQRGLAATEVGPRETDGSRSDKKRPLTQFSLRE